MAAVADALSRIDDCGSDILVMAEKLSSIAKRKPLGRMSKSELVKFGMDVISISRSSEEVAKVAQGIIGDVNDALDVLEAKGL